MAGGYANTDEAGLNRTVTVGNGQPKVVRGGSFGLDQVDAACASRNYDSPNITSTFVVFGWWCVPYCATLTSDRQGRKIFGQRISLAGRLADNLDKLAGGSGD